MSDFWLEDEADQKLVERARLVSFKKLSMEERKKLLSISLGYLDEKSVAKIKQLQQEEIKHYIENKDKYNFKRPILKSYQIRVSIAQLFANNTDYNLLNSMAYSTAMHLYKTKKTWLEERLNRIIHADPTEDEQATRGRKVNPFWTPKIDEKLLDIYYKTPGIGSRTHIPEVIKELLKSLRLVESQRDVARNLGVRQVREHVRYLIERQEKARRDELAREKEIESWFDDIEELG